MVRSAIGHTLRDSQTIGASGSTPAQVSEWRLVGRAQRDRFRVLIVAGEGIPMDVTLKTARNFLGRERQR